MKVSTFTNLFVNAEKARDQGGRAKGHKAKVVGWTTEFARELP